jgi:methylase of polypeptide subunit release factors
MKLMPIEVDKWMNEDDPQTTILDSGIKLVYPQHLEGGCFWLKDEFIAVIKDINKHPYKHCFEWCSGLGGIGFENLGHNLCEKITFNDYYDLAIENCLENAKNNSLIEKVKGYITHTISTIPDDDKWDLVIGTPPHCFDAEQHLEYLNKENKNLSGSLSASNWARLTIDDGMEIHKDFFKNIKNHLLDDADLLILGNKNQNDMLLKLSEIADLKFKKSYQLQRYGMIYYFSR